MFMQCQRDMDMVDVDMFPMSHLSTGAPTQSTGPPMNRIISRTFLAQFGLVKSQLKMGWLWFIISV